MRKENHIMEKEYKAFMKNLKKSRKILIGLLIGSLFGAAVMVFIAPYSGRQTRSRIYQKGMQLHSRFVKNKDLEELV
jgi:gas vesicle protein